MKHFLSLLSKENLDLTKTFLKHELSLMEQGTWLGFILSFLNNVVMLLVFHLLFVNTFLKGVPNSWLYLLLGIVQWNLYINVSMSGFSCLIYRQKIIMGFSFPRELIIFARTGAVFVPYLAELTLIIIFALIKHVWPTEKLLLLPLFLICEYLFCVGLCSFFAFIGVLHKNIIPFWNIMFRLISFATPIFYIPMHFGSPLMNLLYISNPFTLFMIWIRDIISANGFAAHFNVLKILAGSIILFYAGYTLFRKMEHKIGDYL